MAISSPPRRGGQAAPGDQRGLITGLIVVAATVVALAVVVALLARGGSPSRGLQGSGVAATQSRALPPFSSVDMAGSANVTVVVGGRQSVVVHADNNLMRDVTTGVTAGSLVIGTTGSFTLRSPMSVEVSVPSLAAVRLSGSGQISVTGISAPRLTVTLPGSGALYAYEPSPSSTSPSAAPAWRSSTAWSPGTRTRSSAAQALSAWRSRRT
jgi:hypothetical protein